MKSLKTATLVSALALATGLSGCNQSDSRENGDDLDGVPEVAAFALTLTDTPEAESGAGANDFIDSDSAAAGDVDPQADGDIVADELVRARGAVRHLNQAVRKFMEPVVALVRNTEPSSKEGGVRVWGPVTRGETEYRFTLRRGTARHFGWRLEARAADTDSAFLRVAAGGITVGLAARRGTGSLGLDLDALAEVDPDIVARGLLLTGFAHGENGTALAYRLRDFTPDPAAHAPVDALIQGVHLKSGVNRARLAYYGNLPESATDAEELVLARIRNIRGLGGRADALVSGGDVIDGSSWVVSECWDATRTSVFRSVRLCPNDGLGGERCEVVSTSGALRDCAAGLALPELPPADPLEDMSDADANVSAPQTMPSDDPPADG
jgi:hypothetical protein